MTQDAPAYCTRSNQKLQRDQEGSYTGRDIKVEMSGRINITRRDPAGVEYCPLDLLT